MGSTGRYSLTDRRDKMLVYGFIGDESGFLEIENKLQAMQKIVGGRMERISLTEGIDLIVNEERKRTEANTL